MFPLSFLNHIFYVCDSHFKPSMCSHPPKLTELADKAKFLAITDVAEEDRGWTVESNSVTLTQGLIYCVFPIGVENSPKGSIQKNSPDVR